MTGADYLTVMLYSAAVAVAVGALAWVALRLFARAPIIVHIVTIVVAAVAAVAGGIALVANAMYISEDDVAVAINVTMTSGLVSVGMAIGLGVSLSRAAQRLRRAATQLGTGGSLEPARAVTAELAAVHDELVESSRRLRTARAETELSEQARRELVTRIAHDLMAPLAGIRAIAESLEDGLSPDPAQHLRQLSSQVKRTTALVYDLFAVSRIDAGELTLSLDTVSLTDLASDVVAEFTELARARGLRLQFEATESVTVHVDSRELSRVLVNLMTNAFEHSPDGGVVEVSVAREGDTAALSVRDQGPGIPDADLPHLFEPGWRRSLARTPGGLDLSGGAGLGLAIADAVVAAHGGSIRVTALDPGTQFTVRLPLGRQS